MIEYWLAHAHGADFVSVDARTASRDGTLATDEFTATEKFAAVARWLRDRTALPIWWSEFYVQPQDARWSEAQQDAVMTRALMTMAESGASVALIWQPEGAPGACHGCLWSDTATSAGGEPTPFARSLSAFVAGFPAGVRLSKVSVSSPKVEALASMNTLLLVNTSADPVQAVVGDQSVPLGGYEVRYVARSA